jgi:(p)ppGpp synthase/HD superfamily hydrolase
MKMLSASIALASKKFLDTLDKGGNPYILHCLRVMNGVDQNDEDLMCIAVMHDLVEDTDVTLDDLRSLGFSERVIRGVDTMSHRDEEDYETYIKRIALNPDAVKVKRADLIDNSNITRLKGLRKKDFDRLEKYSKAFIYLKDL